MKKYQVAGWMEFFESAKSRTYKHRSQCYMPNKHGLGYRRLVKMPDGPAMFGAWCSLCQILSRQYPRQGYLTDTGSADGRAYTEIDLELMTDIPANIQRKMLSACSSQEIGWLVVTNQEEVQGYHEDTTGIPQDHNPSPLPLPLPLPSKGEEMPPEPPEGDEEVKRKPWNPTPLIIEINRWYDRENTTRWNAKELKALKVLLDGEEHPPEFEVVKAYYGTGGIRQRKPGDYRRKEVLTLLNNWNGEIDRAKQFILKQRESRPGFAPEVVL